MISDPEGSLKFEEKRSILSKWKRRERERDHIPGSLKCVEVQDTSSDQNETLSRKENFLSFSFLFFAFPHSFRALMQSFPSSIRGFDLIASYQSNEIISSSVHLPHHIQSFSIPAGSSIQIC